jgi:hypothetical protein
MWNRTRKPASGREGLRQASRSQVFRDCPSRSPRPDCAAQGLDDDAGELSAESFRARVLRSEPIRGTQSFIARKDWLPASLRHLGLHQMGLYSLVQWKFAVGSRPDPQSRILDIILATKPAAGGLNAHQTDLVGSSEWNDLEYRAVPRANLRPALSGLHSGQ